MTNFLTGSKIVLVSDVLVAEIERAPQNVKNLLAQLQNAAHEFLESNSEIENLAQRYIQKGILEKTSMNDARHIATASFYKADVLVSWNFKHIVNYKRIHLIQAANLEEGYLALEIRNPKEVIDYEK
jgi:hypothetical protein